MIEISVLFVTLSSVLSKALLTVLNFSFRYFTCDILVFIVWFKEETVWVHPILKLSKISFTNALFQASFPELVDICSRFCIFLTGSLSFLNMGKLFFSPTHSTTSLLLLACQIPDTVSYCLYGSSFNNLPQTIGLLGRGKHQEQALGTNVSFSAEENWSHSIICFKTV